MLHCVVVDLLERDFDSPSDLFGSQYQAWAMWIKGVMWCQHIAFCKLGVILWVPFISFLSTNLKVTYFFLRKSHLLHACHALIYVALLVFRHCQPRQARYQYIRTGLDSWSDLFYMRTGYSS